MDKLNYVNDCWYCTEIIKEMLHATYEYAKSQRSKEAFEYLRGMWINTSKESLTPLEKEINSRKAVLLNSEKTFGSNEIAKLVEHKMSRKTALKHINELIRSGILESDYGNFINKVETLVKRIQFYYEPEEPFRGRIFSHEYSDYVISHWLKEYQPQEVKAEADDLADDLILNLYKNNKNSIFIRDPSHFDDSLYLFDSKS